MYRYFKILIFALITLMPISAYAQNADKLFNEGMSLMQKARTEKKSKSKCITNCKNAIKKFKAAKAISSAIAGKCDEQIGYANTIIANPYPRAEAPVQPKAPKDSLVVDVDTISIDYLSNESKVVKVASSKEDWKVSTTTEAAAWCEVKKSDDGKSFSVKCEPLGTTIGRNAVVVVTNGVLHKEIPVMQSGIPVRLSVKMGKKEILGIKMVTWKDIQNNAKNVPPSEEVNSLELKKKGDTKDLEITCNSDSICDNECNWYVAEKPDWCDVQMNIAKNQKNQANEFKTDSRTKVRAIKVVIKAVPKGDSSVSHLGRIGDLVIRSQEQEVRIRLIQNK
ncbi:MAG: BACON domain-containing protein [Bacteroidaceae bacterium]|nr:BACON domain-containing protein [Bacteroidaceae bacterium]